eukprot:724530-Prymnesium_polylepis.2
MSVAQGSEQRSLHSTDMNPTATVRVPAAYKCCVSTLSSGVIEARLELQCFDSPPISARPRHCVD